MKNNLLNPGFEFMFCLGIIAMMALPSLVMAKQPQEFKVTIVKNDTIINGKNIKELSIANHKRIVKRINEICDHSNADKPISFSFKAYSK